MMTRRGHHVIHYGHEASKVECSEHVTIMRDADLKAAYGEFDWKRGLLQHRIGDLAHRTFNERAVAAVSARRAPKSSAAAPEILLLFWGQGHKPVAEALPDLLAVDPGLGCFNAPATDHTVYVSYALQSHILGKTGKGPGATDAVIPNYFDLTEFAPRLGTSTAPKPYLVFFGRLIKSKGIDIAVATAKRLSIPLKIAGQGDLAAALGGLKPPEGLVEHVGYLEPAARAAMLAGATALIAPSQYDEPFGKVVIEAGLCGTPVITSDWGGFSEIVLQGITGYRCRTEEHFVAAGRLILEGRIQRRACRAWAAANFSLEKVAPMFETYFQRISGLAVASGGGAAAALEELEAMRREYPSLK
jgi:glycosyltransferase involved in cell wall biosynthesis